MASTAAPAHTRDKGGVISSTPPEQGEKRFGDPDRNPGPLMGKSKSAVAREAYRLFMSRQSEMARRIAEWGVNEYRRQGISEARLIKEQDRWISWIPRWMEDDPSAGGMLNAAARLCRQFASQMFADPPAPEAIPASGEDADVDAAETATRLLIDIQSESGLDDTATLRHAFDLASTYDSGFIRYFIDPRGGGKTPVEVQAGYADAEMGVGVNEFGETVEMEVSPARQAEHFSDAEIDPLTQLRWPSYRQRYVREDGTLTDERYEAATRWVPTLESEVLTGRNVRLIPHTAIDVSKARGVQIGYYETWGNLKETNPDLANLSDDRKTRLLGFRPSENEDSFLPHGTDPAVLSKSSNPNGSDEDRNEARVFCILTYYRACDEYKDGLYLWTAGDSEVVYSDDWVLEDEGAREPMLIPVVQVKQFQEGTVDPYGRGMMRILGAGNDLAGKQVASFIDYLDWHANRKVFLPTSSILTPQDMNGSSRFLRKLAGPNNDPSFEDIPDYPSMGVDFFKLVREEMKEDSGLSALSGNLLDASSGRQAYAAVSQAHAGLSEPRQFVARAYVRGCRIQLQMIRAFFDREQQVRWLGEDNRFKVESWSVADLRSTKDVRLSPGTLTGLTPAQKTQLLEHYAEMKLLAPETLAEALTENVGGTIALQDNPMRNRIRGQLADWAVGPPEQWVPRNPAEDGQDPAWSMWEPVPSDLDPEVRAVRHREIKLFMQSYRYRRWPLAWRKVVDAEYERMSGAAPAPAGAVPAEAIAPPQEPMPFGLAPMDTVPPEIAGALPPEQAGIPSANVGRMPVDITRGA